MSRVTVFKIDQKADVVHYAEIRNGIAGGLFIWMRLSPAAGLGEFNMVTAALGGGCPLWEAFGTSKLTEDESIAIGFTFDNVWVKRENLPRLAKALQSFWSRFGGGETAPTIPGIIESVRQLAEDETCRGACFWQTSVSGTEWILPPPDDDSDSRGFNFDTDKVTGTGKAPWELFEALDPMLAKNGAKAG